MHHGQAVCGSGWRASCASSGLRRPLGIAIIGGLVASQVLTLLTTPVVYLLMDKLRRRSPLENQLSRHNEPLPA